MVKLTERKIGNFRGCLITTNIMKQFQYRGGIVLLFVFVNLNAWRLQAFVLMLKGQGDVGKELKSIGCAYVGAVEHIDSGGMTNMDVCWVWRAFGWWDERRFEVFVLRCSILNGEDCDLLDMS